MSFPVIKCNSVILDFDGVVFDNKKINALVSHRSNQFISKKMSVDMNKAKELNNYKKTGHSVFSIDDDYKNIIHDYNDYVFSEKNRKEYANMITQENKDIFKQLVDIKNKRDLTCYLFTNGPIHYCVDIMHACDSRFDLLFQILNFVLF